MPRPGGNPDIKDKGKKFSKDYQPEYNPGRPVNKFKQFHGQFECSRADIEAMLVDLMNKDNEELTQIKNDKKELAIRCCIASAILEDKKRGSLNGVNFLIERLFGKSVQRVESNIQINNEDPAVASVLSKHGIADKN